MEKVAPVVEWLKGVASSQTLKNGLAVKGKVGLIHGRYSTEWYHLVFPTQRKTLPNGFKALSLLYPVKEEPHNPIIIE